MVSQINAPIHSYKKDKKNHIHISAPRSPGRIIEKAAIDKK